MKNSIIYLGIALVTFTNAALAVDFQQSYTDENLITANAAQTIVSVGENNGKSSYKAATSKDKDAETITLDIATPYQKTIEEVIAENNQIIESEDSYTANENLNEALFGETVSGEPQFSEQTIEERILQDSQIIESPLLNAIEINNQGIAKKS